MNTAANVEYLESGEGPVVVFLHGIGVDSRSFRFQLDAFASSGYRAVAWDMPGYGGSASLNPMTFPGLADGLLYFLDELDVDNAHVVGHSIGGMVVQELARTAQERLASMTLAQTSPAFGKQDGSFQQQFISERLQPLQDGKTMAEIAEQVIPRLIGEAPAEEGVQLARDCMSRIPADSYAAAVKCLVEFEGRDHLARIAVPTLVLAGEKDTNAPVPMMEKMAQKIPDAEFFVISGVGHLAPMENPEAFNQLILAFLVKHATQRG